LYRLFKAIKQANVSVRKAFQIIDKDGSNSVSKSEMETAFRNIGIDISMTTVDYIFKVCDDDQNGTINCSEFEKLFEDIIRESAIEEK
jgi:Ca2+-binding EF-hand superfamily protein